MSQENLNQNQLTEKRSSSILCKNFRTPKKKTSTSIPSPIIEDGGGSPAVAKDIDILSDGLEPVAKDDQQPLESAIVTGTAPNDFSKSPFPSLITESVSQHDTILSSMPLSDWRGSATAFDGFTGTRPVEELNDVGWIENGNFWCPTTPEILSDKKIGKYGVPCALKVGTLIGETLKAAQRNGTPTTGKMRSMTHVTHASTLLMDVDGLPEADFQSCLDKLKADGLTFKGFTTHSHGSTLKPDSRARLVIPIDRPVSVEEYSVVWRGFDKRYLDGKAGKADSSGSKMYQQQGTWCCHPSRVDKAQSWFYEGGVASTSFLLKSGEVVQETQAAHKEVPVAKEKKIVAETSYPPSDANKIADGCQQIGAFRDTKGAGQSEPLWFDCLGVVAHCKDGEAICQELSSGHSGYDKDETTKKIAHRKQTPPTTCEQFKKTNPDGCKDCTQKCKSPITLGLDASEREKDALLAIQQQCALLKLDSKFFVLEMSDLNAKDEKGNIKPLNLYNRTEGRTLLKRALKAQYPQANATSIVEDFWESPQTKCYEGVEFNPKGTSEKYLNLWIGPTITPKAGSWNKINEFFLEVICDGDQASYEYLISYIAHALQRPEEKPGVMVNLLGGQGIGKGTLGVILKKIWSATYLFVNDINKVTGNFNAILERNYCVFMDEALFAGNYRATDALKSLVTDSYMHIEQKYQPARQIRSYHRFVSATNANHLKNTERDDRRDFTLRVSELHKNDFPYFEALHHEIDNGGVEAMAYELLEMDLSNFNVRNKPNTKELLEQKLLSLDPIFRWWYECLCSGSLSEDERWPSFVATSKIIDEVIKLSGGKMHQNPSPANIKQAMEKLCPSAKSAQKPTPSGRHRGFSLPSLQQARDEFEKYIAGTVQWPEYEELLTPSSGKVGTEDITSLDGF